MLLRKKDVEVVKNGEFCLVSRKKSFVDIELLQADEPPLMGASTQRRQWQRQRWADDSPQKEHAVRAHRHDPWRVRSGTRPGGAAGGGGIRGQRRVAS